MSSRAEYAFDLVHRMLVCLSSILAFIVLLFWIMRYCRHRRRREDGVDKKRSLLRKLLLLENPRDGLFAFPGVGPTINSVISAFIIIFVLGPVCIISLCYFWALLIASAGSWRLNEAFWIVVFCLGFKDSDFYPNAVSKSTSEDMKLLGFGVFALIQINVVLTLVSMLNCIVNQFRHFREGPLFTLGLLCLILPLLVLVLCGLGGVLLMLGEGLSFTKAVFYHVNWVISGGNWPIHMQVEAPDTDIGAMVAIYLACVAVPVNGIVIGFIGGLPGIAHLKDFLEGAVFPESSCMQEVVVNKEEELMSRTEDQKTLEELRQKLRQTEEALRQAEEAGSQAKKQNMLLLAHLGLKDFAEAQQQLFDKQKVQSDSWEFRDGIIINDHSNAEPVAKSPNSGIPQSFKRLLNIICQRDLGAFPWISSSMVNGDDELEEHPSAY